MASDSNSAFQVYVSYAISIIIALTGFLMAIGKLRITKPKESTEKEKLMSHEEVLRDSPIFHYVDRDVQRSQNEIQQLNERLRAMEIKMAQMEGQINTLRAEMRK